MLGSPGTNLSSTSLVLVLKSPWVDPSPSDLVFPRAFFPSLYLQATCLPCTWPYFLSLGLDWPSLTTDFQWHTILWSTTADSHVLTQIWNLQAKDDSPNLHAHPLHCTQVTAQCKESPALTSQLCTSLCLV